ncbi:mitotic checkpoint serine/threonine-protein kinase BUB1 beta-like isoform X2 [Mizuhopecten yessoensis]|nr:mitotic checkpoint serine/threonine-protein kinase BUB1 beta-like isoform X2 [Mizuhopecten yessoensis]
MQWIEQNYPKGGKECNLADLLERCLRTFYNEPRYKNDLRFVTAWIKYADFCKEPLEIYNFMKDQAIGVDLASFYLAWAWTNEQMGNSKKSDLIFQEGIRRLAQPLDVLERRHKEFQMRMMREGMIGTAETEPAGQAEDQRAVLGHLRPHGQKKKAPVQRTGHAKMASRGGLKMLGLAPPQVQGQAFTVFNDENANPSLPAEVGDWSEMPTQSVLHKENTKKAGVWTKQKIGYKGGVVPVRAVGANTPAFTIHVEEDADQSMVTPRKTLEVGNPVLSARKPDKYVDPLQHIRQTEDCTHRLMYCKDKIQCGTEEYSFEELRAARWRARRKQEGEKQRREEQEKQMTEYREEMQRSRDILREEAERIRQEQIALCQEHEAMVQQCHQQMQIQQAQFNTERQTQLQRQQEMLEHDIQQRMSLQLNFSSSTTNQGQVSKGLSSSSTDHQGLVSRGLSTSSIDHTGLAARSLSSSSTDHLQGLASKGLSSSSTDHTVPAARGISSSLTDHTGLASRGLLSQSNEQPISAVRTRDIGAMKHLVFGDTNSIADKTKNLGNSPTLPSMSDGQPSPSSIRQSVTSVSSPTVNTRETMQLVQGLFNASLDIERHLGWCDNLELTHRTDTTAGQGSIDTTAQSTTSKTSGGLQFAIYDESQETENSGK